MGKGVQPGHWGRQQGKPKCVAKDKMYQAMKPGKRVSQFGNAYFEYRANRTDKNPKKRL